MPGEEVILLLTGNNVSWITAAGAMVEQWGEGAPTAREQATSLHGCDPPDSLTTKERT